MYVTSLTLRSSIWAYYRWFVSLLGVGLYTWWFYFLYEVSPEFREFKLGFSLMVGWCAILIVRLFDFARRHIDIDHVGIHTNSFIGKGKTIFWQDIQAIEVWSNGPKAFVCRVKLNVAPHELTLESNNWRPLDLALKTIREATKLSVSSIYPAGSGLRQAVYLILLVLGVSLVSFVPIPLVRAAGTLLARFVWGRFLILQEDNLPAIRLYMTSFMIGSLAALLLIAEDDFSELLWWWLYSPMIELILSYFLVQIRKLWQIIRE